MFKVNTVFSLSNKSLGIVKSYKVLGRLVDNDFNDLAISVIRDTESAPGHNLFISDEILKDIYHLDISKCVEGDTLYSISGDWVCIMKSKDGSYVLENQRGNLCIKSFGFTDGVLKLGLGHTFEDLDYIYLSKNTIQIKRKIEYIQSMYPNICEFALRYLISLNWLE